MSDIFVEKLLLDLINIPSLSENELNCCTFIYRLLKKLSFDQVKKIPVDKDGFNIIAIKGKAKIALQAHIDTVPPFIKAKTDDRKIYGRGACDTKSCVAAMIAAAEKALTRNLTNFALIFTVGEETNFRGIKKLVETNQKIPYAIVGEPTQLKPINGHYGIGTITIIAKGKSVHSSMPELGTNAIDKLLAGVNRLAKLKPEKGSLLSLVKISGGHAENSIPDKAQALYSLRISPQDKNSDFLKLFQEKLKGLDLEIKPGLIIKPVHSKTPKKLKFLGQSKTVRYATELSFLKNGLVLGPGNIKYAHSINEFIEKKELERAVELYFKILQQTNQSKNTVLPNSF